MGDTGSEHWWGRAPSARDWVLSRAGPTQILRSVHFRTPAALTQKLTTPGFQVYAGCACPTELQKDVLENVGPAVSF